MLINTECPQCHTRYQVQDSLLGKKMRCTDKQCRAAFEVRDLSSARETPGLVPQEPMASRSQHKEIWTGNVNDLVQLLPAEQVQPSPSVQPAPPPDLPTIPLEGAEMVELPVVRNWEDAPPVRGGPTPPPSVVEPSRKPTSSRRTTKTNPPPRSVPAAATEPTQNSVSPPAPVEIPPGEWAAPPVRTETAPEVGPSDAAEEENPLIHEEMSDEAEGVLLASRRRKARWLMVGIVASVAIILSGAGGVAWYLLTHTEEQLWAAAQKSYDEESFGVAAGKFDKLAEAFPESPRAEEYRFMGRLSRLRGSVADAQTEHGEAFRLLRSFLSENQEDPFLREHAKTVGVVLVKRLDRYRDETLPQPIEGTETGVKPVRDLLTDARNTMTVVQTTLPKALGEPERKRLLATFDQIDTRIQEAVALEKALASLEQLALAPSADAVKRVRLEANRLGIDFPQVPKHPRTLRVLEETKKKHRDSIRYILAAEVVPPPVLPEDVESDIIVDAFLTGQAKQGTPGELAFALSRGVLYALDGGNGATRWARRVGIDTAQLPIRLPATPAVPFERLLVLSTDTNVLTALNLENEVVWRYRLGAPCVGEPIIQGETAWLPTVDGYLHEIELVKGNLLGRYTLGHRLTNGGVLDARTGKLYLPADDASLYVLDVKTRTLDAVVETGHSSGSLRGAPLLLTSPEADKEDTVGIPSFLVLQQTSGLDATLLRVYALPLTADSQPLTMTPEPRLQGWTWFRPYYDTEKVAILSDAGAFGLFGIKQLNNRDNPLFPLLPLPPGTPADHYSGIDLRTLFGTPGTDGSNRSRAEMVHVADNEFWILSQGQLQRLQLRFTSKQGPRLVPVWDKPLELGSPLHVSRWHASKPNPALIVVSQPLDRQVCLASAIEPDANVEMLPRGDARLRWQRQLGLMCRGEPLVVGKEILVPDQGGGLYRFQPATFPQGANTRFYSSSEMVRRSVGTHTALTRFLLPSPDGASAWQILPEETGGSLLLRRYPPLPEETPEIQQQGGYRIELPRGTRLSGTPALVGKSLLVPLSDGRLMRFGLPPATDSTPGLDWRARNAPPGAICHVVPLGGDKFLLTDGRRGITCFEWKDDVQEALPREGRKVPAHELPDRLASVPLVVSAPESKEGLLVCVGDVRGVLHLLRGESLAELRRWEVNGTITAGPFLVGKLICCVVDRQRLLAFSLEQETAKWSHRQSAPLVGQPRLIDNMLVLADEDGKFLGLDPRTGKAIGPGYRLRATVAPMAAPVPFDRGRALVPLSDGTILLLALNQLRPDFWELPLWQGIDPSAPAK